MLLKSFHSRWLYIIKYFSNRKIHLHDANIGTCSWICLRCFFTFYLGKLPLNHHLGAYCLLVPSILSKSKFFKHSSIRFVNHTDSHGFSQINQFRKFIMLSKGVLETATQCKEGISIYIVYIYIYIHTSLLISCDKWTLQCAMKQPLRVKRTPTRWTVLLYTYICIHYVFIQ